MTGNKRKNVKLADDEINFIRRHSKTMDIDKIASSLNRDKRSIQKYIKMYSKIDGDENINVSDRRRTILKALKEESFWELLQDQFSDKELKYFADQWFNNVLQFEQTSPLLHTEKMQLVELIKNQILMDRCLEKQRNNIKEIENLTKMIKAEEEKREKKNLSELDLLYEQRNLLETVSSSYTKELKDIQSLMTTLRTSLKATREQRVKIIVDSKTDYATKIKLLDEEENAYREGREMVLFRLAMEKERRRLSQYHEYMDGEEDIPLLTPELVESLRIQNEQGAEDGEVSEES